MKLKQRGQAEQLRAAPKSGLRKMRGGTQKAAGKQVKGQAEMLASRVEPYADTARKAMSGRASDAWDRASDAWERAEPRLGQAAETVQKDIAPRVSSAINTAAERSAPAREEALERGTAAFAALRGEPAPPRPKKKRRWPVAILCLLIGGAAGAAGAVATQRRGPAFDAMASPSHNAAASGSGSTPSPERPSGGEAQPPQDVGR